jgi:hypothetical protein
MKKEIRTFLHVREFITWIVISLCCLIVIVTFVKLSIASLSSEEEIFWPGIAVLFIAVLAFTVYSVSRVWKYFKRMKEKD